QRPGRAAPRDRISAGAARRARPTRRRWSTHGGAPGGPRPVHVAPQRAGPARHTAHRRMSVVFSGLSVLLSLLAFGLLLPAAYLVGLTLGALVAPRRVPPPGPGRRRFAILVPAHDEEPVIGRLLRSLAALDYPHDRFDVCLVADNCSDATARIARSAGA